MSDSVAYVEFVDQKKLLSTGMPTKCRDSWLPKRPNLESRQISRQSVGILFCPAQGPSSPAIYPAKMAGLGVRCCQGHRIPLRRVHATRH
jgi:hypothetical protein